MNGEPEVIERLQKIDDKLAAILIALARQTVTARVEYPPQPPTSAVGRAVRITEVASSS